MHVLLADLLPVIFDNIVEAHTRKDIIPFMREAILRALTNSLRLSETACFHESSSVPLAYSSVHTLVTAGMPETRPIASDSLSDSSVHTLITTDRFSSRWASREEILFHIRKGSNISQRLANIALLLIEARMDTYLKKGKSLTVNKVGTFRFDDNRMVRPSDEGKEWYNQALSTALGNLSAQCNPTLLSLFKRSPCYLTTFVESLELCAVCREPAAYMIDFYSEPELNSEKNQPAKEMIWNEASAKQETRNTIK